MRLAALLLAAAAAGAETPVGNPPLVGGAVEGLVFDGSHFVALQRGVQTSLAADGTPLTSNASDDSVALASSGRGALSISIVHGIAYASGNVALGPADAAATAWDGARYAVAWRDGHELKLAFIGDGGNVSAAIDVADDADAFGLAAHDGATLVAWASGRSLFACTASGATAALGGTGMSACPPLGDGELGDVAGGDDGFVVTTLAGGAIVAKHLDRAGHPDASYTLAPSARGARIARERYAYALVWPDGNRVDGMRLDPFGMTQGPFVVATLGAPVDDVAIAATPAAATLVAYASHGVGAFAKSIDDTGPGKALPAHLARQSNVFAGDAAVVWQQESEIRVDDNAVAEGTLQEVLFDGASANIVFRDTAGLWSLRWPSGGAPSPIASMPAGTQAIRAWNENNTIVAQQQSGARIVVDNGPSQKGTPHVRWDGAAWVITWPEIVDSTTAAFASLRLGGSKRIVATAPLPLSLTDWSETAAAVYYIRDGRLFMQRVAAPVRRRVTSSAASRD